MAPSISTLHPASHSRPTALALKLNPEVLHQLRALHSGNETPKLVVKNGKFSIKLSDSVNFPCSTSVETLRFDIYSLASSSHDYSFTGTVTNRLNVISDPKQIKEHLKSSASAASTAASSKPSPTRPDSPATASVHSLSIDSPAYQVLSKDSPSDITSRFISLLALGPMTAEEIVTKIDPRSTIPKSELSSLISMHTQAYSANDAFKEGDVYPLVALGSFRDEPNKPYLILKDKAYKELRPWQWPYTDFERSLVVDNLNRALSRLGYSETHPLRLRLVEKTSPIRAAPKKSTTLGGGLLGSGAKKLQPVSSTATPVPASPVPSHSIPFANRAFTESPRLESEARKRAPLKGNRVAALPEKRNDRSHVVSSSSSASSSEDEKLNQKIQGSRKRFSNASNTSNSSVNSNTSNIGNASYTSPSSTNDDLHSDHSDHDSRARGSTKTIPPLPSRPPSAFSSHEKRLQFYMQLADKFRLKYKEYERLHKQLSKGPSKSTASEKKRNVIKLYELHTLLSEWKQRIWDFHNENSMEEGIMHLSKHRKSNSASKYPSSVPSSSILHTSERFHKPPSGHLLGDRPPPSTLDSVRKQALVERPVQAKAKVTLNY